MRTKSFLEDKSAKTQKSINIYHALFEPTSDCFIVRATDKPEEVKALLEVGFEYVCQKDNRVTEKT